jgi:alpha,alpha-trehalose phosphorylase
MAARNLRAAADAARRYARRAAALGVERADIAEWEAAADAMVVPYDAELGVTAQSQGFTRYRQWDFHGTPPDAYPLLLHYPYYLLYSSQVVKQPDLVFALYCCGDQFDFAQKQRDFAYYEAITVRDSSLSASIHAVVAAEVGHVELAYDYLRETALVDLHDLSHNTDHGVHLASLAGTWLALVAGFGGLRDHGDTLAFAPCLPNSITRLCFHLLYRGRRLTVEVEPGRARYELTEGEPLELLHHGTSFRLQRNDPVIREWELTPPGAPASPPAGRAPSRRDGARPRDADG